MANVKITELTALTAADSAATDVLPIVDVSADATKKLAISDLHRSVPDGTLSAPGIAFQSDLNSGLYRSGTDAIALVTNGAARISIDATGNVTIPNNLTVEGTTTFIDSQTLRIEDKNIELGVVSSPSNTTADGGGITLKGASDKTITWVNSTGAWTFNQPVNMTGGSVGIGTSSPSTTLDVKASSAAAYVAQFADSATAEPAKIYVDANGIAFVRNNFDDGIEFASNSLRVYVNGSKRMDITSTGNAEFGGNVQAGGNAFSGTAAGSIVESGGRISVCNTGSNSVFHGHQQGGSKNIDLKADGAASFAGTNFEIDETGQLTIKKTAAFTDPSFKILDRNNSNADGVLMYGNGSATFEAGVNVRTQDAARGLTVNCSSASQNEALKINANGGAQVILLKHDGSASFAGDNVTIANGTSGEGKLEIYRPGPTVKDAFVVGRTTSDVTAVIQNNGSATFAGNVGIGNSAMSSFTGNASENLVVGSGSGSEGITVYSAAQGSITFADGTSGDAAYRGAVEYNHTSDYMSFRTAGTGNRMVIDSSGTVLFGGTSTADNDHANIDANGKLTIRRSSASDDAIVVKEGSTSSFLVEADGFVANFNVGSSAFTAYDNEAGVSGPYAAMGAASGEARITAGSTASDDVPLVFRTASSGTETEAARFDSNGNLLFNKTEVNFANAGVEIRKAGEITLTRAGDLLTTRRVTSEGTHISIRAVGGSVVGTVSSNGTNASFNTSSDYRLKENVSVITDGITRVKQLAPKRFNFISNPDLTVDGFIAHEAQTVVPEAVTGTHDEVDGDGNAVMQGIDQSKLVPLLTAALQEAIAKIESLETRIAALES